ncbi:HepT-like ribonuclease domain-containing protein [Vulcanisaeta thermophila]|uniref:HepT-like ribonuclease domain-containing protein n=1 Tax=Vulcanisaeta thermophila TaxID=867917 RepID=UPI000852F79B|nr:HepT-like ribonuclease domain-containing protein [Vulcanisaeta thermophila]
MILKQKLTLTMSYTNILKSLRSKVNSAESLKDPIPRGAIEKHLHLTAEAPINIGMRLYSILKPHRPNTHRDEARILKETNILNPNPQPRTHRPRHLNNKHIPNHLNSTTPTPL